MNERIEALRSPRGGWTKAALAELGVPWPPPKGWKKALETAILDESSQYDADRTSAPLYSRQRPRAGNRADSTPVTVYPPGGALRLRRRRR